VVFGADSAMRSRRRRETRLVHPAGLARETDIDHVARDLAFSNAHAAASDSFRPASSFPGNCSMPCRPRGRREVHCPMVCSRSVRSPITSASSEPAALPSRLSGDGPG
jgi:hypothetical protein